MRSSVKRIASTLSDRRLAPSLFVLASACATVPLARVPGADEHSEIKGTLSLFLGKSRLQSEKAFPIEGEDVAGFSLRVIDANSTVGGEFGYLSHRGTNAHETIPGSGTFDFRTDTSEIFFGLWVPIETRSFYHPYFGVGMDLIHVRVHESAPGFTDAERDDGGGAYAKAGLLFDLTRHLQAGAELRGVLGNRLDLFGVRTYADYTQFMFTIAYTF